MLIYYFVVSLNVLQTSLRYTCINLYITYILQIIVLRFITLINLLI